MNTGLAREAEFGAALVDHGLQVAFGVTGSGSSWRLISAMEDAGAKYFPASHEAAAAIMAGAATRATGRTSISVGIKGPGLLNMLGGIAYNNFENVPALSACEAYGSATPSFRMHKRVDHDALLAPVTKRSVSLAFAARHVSDLLTLAREEVPGPLHIELHEVRDRDPPLRRPVAESASNDDTRAAALRLLEAATRPILVVGSLAARRDWAAALESLRVPVFTTAAAKGVIDEGAPCALGVFTGDGKELAPESAAFREADLVVALGVRNLEVLSPKRLGARILMVDEASAEHAEGFEPDVFFETREPGDYETVLRHLAVAPAWGGGLAHDLKVRLSAAYDVAAWQPPGCLEALNALPYDYTLAADTGTFCTLTEHLWHASRRRRYLGSSNGRFMGGSVPTAIGAAAADPRVPVFCLCGDGGFRMYPADVALAVRHRLPICFVLFSDGRFGSVAVADPTSTLSRTAVEIPVPSWLKVIEQMGCPSIAPGSVPRFEDAVRRWDRNGPLFLECRFEPEAYALSTARLR